MHEVFISSDKERLNLDLIHSFLSNSYWAKGRTPAQVKTTVDNSLCYGLYKDDQQIGFARLVTDRAVFAYIMDVFVVETERGKGYAVQLMEFILKDPELAVVSRWMLGTRDAHALYRKFGFSEIPHPEWVMGMTRTI